MEISELKTRVMKEIEARRSQLNEISLKIHANPELGFKEEKAAALLTSYLEENGFSVERGICDLPTAFRASYGTGKPKIAILAEYDALPNIGHACGHNIIATSAIGAATGARAAIDRLGGTISVIGTPAEELYGGKVLMAGSRAFDGLDVAMIVHPGGTDSSTTYSLACQTLNVEFFGKSAHAAASPEEGINALEAMIQSYNAINSLRQHIRDTARIHGIITDGGEAANVVPAHSSANFIVRARENDYLEELKEKVLNCFIGAATATGARLYYEWDKVRYAPMRNNMILAGIFARNMQALGRDAVFSSPEKAFGSTDMGNVSQIVPSIHGNIAITGENVQLHSVSFADAAASENGLKGIIAAAGAMAMTIIDILSDPDTLAAIKNEFEQSQ